MKKSGITRREWLFSKELYFIAFDQEMAEASGVPARKTFSTFSH